MEEKNLNENKINQEETIFDINEELPEVKQIEYAIQIKDLYKSYGKKDVLKGLNANVKKGEVYGFIGKNGIGKSTTIDCIVGLKDYDSGEILILDTDNKKDPLKAKNLIGYVPSEPITYEMMSGNEYLQFVASSYGMIQSSFNNNYNFLIKKFGMSPKDMDRKIREYSHGMKQKVCLMASLIHNPKVWILDEPTVGLDIMVYEVLLRMIKEFAVHGRTVFITSHNIELVSKVWTESQLLMMEKSKRFLTLRKSHLKEEIFPRFSLRFMEKKSRRIWYLI